MRNVELFGRIIQYCIATLLTGFALWFTNEVHHNFINFDDDLPLKFILDIATFAATNMLIIIIATLIILTPLELISALTDIDSIQIFKQLLTNLIYRLSKTFLAKKDHVEEEDPAEVAQSTQHDLSFSEEDSINVKKY